MQRVVILRNIPRKLGNFALSWHHGASTPHGWQSQKSDLLCFYALAIMSLVDVDSSSNQAWQYFNSHRDSARILTQEVIEAPRLFLCLWHCLCTRLRQEEVSLSLLLLSFVLSPLVSVSLIVLELVLESCARHLYWALHHYSSFLVHNESPRPWGRQYSRDNVSMLDLAIARASWPWAMPLRCAAAATAATRRAELNFLAYRKNKQLSNNSTRAFATFLSL